MKMWKVVLFCARSFHTSLCSNAKMGKVMRKVMGQTSKRKRIFSESGIPPNAEMFSKGSNEGRYSGSARRVSVLNKLFMKYITDLLATGEYSSEFTGCGIEIHRVQISPDFSGLNVFWLAKGIDNDDVVENLLKKNAGFLRHELSSLRVMGNVPRIQFVKDKEHSQITELDARLAKADFGENHIPVEMATKLKTQLELFTHLSSEVREKVQKLDESSEGNEILVDDLPPMPQDVLGLNHLDILNKIKKIMKKSQASHRFKNECTELKQPINNNPIEFTSNKEQREVFKKFLEKRELLRSQARKMERKFCSDVEYNEEEFDEQHAQYFKNMDIYEDDNDYIDETVELHDNE